MRVWSDWKKMKKACERNDDAMTQLRGVTPAPELGLHAPTNKEHSRQSYGAGN